ncbi:MAG: hypothetical protein WD380_05085 [Gaiellaceae bacterium]
MSLRCARRAEVSPKSLESRARREGWRVLGPGAWLLPGAEPTELARAHGATLAFPGAVVTAWSGAALHGLRRAMSKQVELLRVTGVGDVETRQLVARRTRFLPEEDRTLVDGVPVVAVPRLLRELARVATSDGLRDLLIDARLQDRGVATATARLLERDLRFPGRPQLREVVDELADDGSDSGFEWRVVDRCREAAIEPDAQQAGVPTHLGPRHLDLAWLPERVAIECVGFSFHSTAKQLKRDIHRQNAIAVVDEWLVLQLTWEMFHREWEAFLALLQDCLQARRNARAS